MSEYYQRGSIVANGLELCKDMDTRHREEGRLAYHCGDTSGLWSAMHWVGFNEASVNATMHVLTGDPIAAAWVASGSPSCGATWSDEELAEADEQANNLPY